MVKNFLWQKFPAIWYIRLLSSANLNCHVSFMHMYIASVYTFNLMSSPPSSYMYQSSPQYLTAVVPGPDGNSQYVTLPADPRVLNGQYSYAMLQQPDGSTQIVLVENNSVGKCKVEENSSTLRNKFHHFANLCC